MKHSFKVYYEAHKDKMKDYFFNYFVTHHVEFMAWFRQYYIDHMPERKILLKNINTNKQYSELVYYIMIKTGKQKLLLLEL